MALVCSLEAMAPLSTAREVTLGDIVMEPANADILGEVQHVKRLRMHKAYTVFTAEQRATGGKYTSEPGNTTKVKKLKADC